MQITNNDTQKQPELEQPIDEPEHPSSALLIFLIMPLAGLLIALVMVATDQQPQQDIPSTFAPTQQQKLIDFQAPDFELPMLDGETLVSLADFEGRPLLINFWATWCAPCVRELPALEEFVALHAGEDNGPALLAINIGETSEEVKNFLAELGIQNLPVALDTDQVVKAAYNIQNFPTTFVIDKTGTVRFMKLGEMRFEEMGLYLEQLDSLDDGA